MVELQMSANQAISNSDQYDQKLAEANTQIALLNSITDYMNEPSHKYETLPANIGISDQSAVSLINKYNEIVLERLEVHLKTAPRLRLLRRNLTIFRAASAEQWLKPSVAWTSKEMLWLRSMASITA